MLFVIRPKFGYFTLWNSLEGGAPNLGEAIFATTDRCVEEFVPHV